MRELEKRIAAWRQEMLKARCREQALDELEAHLREEIDRLSSTALSPDEIFRCAMSKLGTPSALAAEFDKLADSRARTPVRLAWIGAAALAGLLSYGLVQFTQHGSILLGAHVICLTLGYMLMFIIGGLAMCDVCARWFAEPSAARRSSLFRCMFSLANVSAIFTVIGVVLGASWARENLGRYWAWDSKEVGALLIICSAVLFSALRWVKPAETTVVCLAIVGSLVTAWGWFGGNALFSGVPFSPYLILFSAGQMVFVLAAVLRSRMEARRDRQVE